MIRIQLTPDALLGARFVVSPLEHLRIAMDSRYSGTAADGLPTAADVTGAIRRGRLRRMALLRGLVDDFGWSPGAPSAFRPAVEDELRALADAHPDFMARLTEHLDRTATPSGREQAARRAALSEVLRSDGEEFTQRLAAEAEQLFHRLLAPHWPALAARVEAEADLRGRVVARSGLSAMLGRLHPAIDCHGDVLVIRDKRELTARVSGPFVLYPVILEPLLDPVLNPVLPCPTALGPRHHGDLGPDRASGPLALTYPVARDRAYPVGADRTYRVGSDRTHPEGRGRGEQPGTGSLDDVLGHSRVRLLAGLGEPRTTSQLAMLHHLSPSTVSYHLTRLHGAGLVTRKRSGSNVYYERSARADIFAPGLPEHGRSSRSPVRERE